MTDETTDPNYSEIAAEIFHASANPTPAELTRARAFLESFTYTTSAIGALVIVLRKQYEGAREAGCDVPEGTPTADALAACIVHIANAEAREV